MPESEGIMTVYVGGRCNGYPWVVAQSPIIAMKNILDNALPNHALEPEWKCVLVDGWIMRCTVAFDTGDGEIEHFYVESVELNQDKETP